MQHDSSNIGTGFINIHGTKINDPGHPIRQKIAGILILLMVVITTLTGLHILDSAVKPLWIAGVAAWSAALLLFVDTSRVLKVQVSLILLIGIAMII